MPDYDYVTITKTTRGVVTPAQDLDWRDLLAKLEAMQKLIDSMRNDLEKQKKEIYDLQMKTVSC